LYKNEEWDITHNNDIFGSHMNKNRWLQ
jgi:hypothetical protein